MCPLSVEPATLISRFTRICGGPNQPASRPIYPEPVAAVSHSDNCRKEDLRWDDSRLNDCLVRRGPLNRRRTGHRRTSSRGGIEKRTVGEMEAAVCQGVSRFEQD